MAKRQNLDFNKLVPSSLKNETLTSLVSNLFNRFVSEEKSVFINGRIGKKVAGDANIQQPTLDRELNALAPALYFKTGTEDNVFTFEDMVHKLNALDADTDNIRAWMKEQTFNYALPVDYDRLINYANYFWTGNSIRNKPNVPWNPEINPEYYVIARPANTDLVKMPVKLATTRQINLYSNDRPPETFTIQFTSNSTFVITSDLGGVTSNTTSLVSLIKDEKTFVEIFSPDSNPNPNPNPNIQPGIDDPNNSPDPLCSFYIINGTTQFAAGDYFTLTITYFTSQIYVTPHSANLIGKGSINGIQTTSPLMYIDGVQLQGGERILVKNQANKSENGIYRVFIGQKWQRTSDANTDDFLPQGSVVYVEDGNLNSQKTFILNRVGADLDFIVQPGNLDKPVNQWQEFNYWYHRDDFDDLAALGYSIENSIQATRPIIEYSNKLLINSAIDADGNPSDTGTTLVQKKTRFNQIPQFDLFRYDGTHHGATSGIFYYIEDPDFSVDPVLQRRVKTTVNYDYIFGTGLQDDQSRLLYYKLDGELRSIWRAGVNAPITTTPKFSSSSDKGSLIIDSISFNADNQDWTIICKSTTQFEVIGSRSGSMGMASLGITFTCEELQLTIQPGSIAYEVNDTYTFSVTAPVSPRYVKKLDDGSIINYPGGVIGDKADSVIDGAWMTPLRMFQNLERETRPEIALGDLMEHVRSVIRNQDGFEGTSFGNNNVRKLTLNEGLGGNIREFGSNFPLLASMLIQKDVSPLTMIDFAEQQYNVALSSIDQFMIDELANYLATTGTLVSSTIDPFASDIQALADRFEQLRGENEILKEIFSDTTANVKNWPVTLPIIGLLPKVQPTVGFDPELGIETIIHHDGHISPLATRNADFDRTLVKSIVLRSDGSSTPGIFSETMPTNPYARQLWMKSSTFVLKLFNVTYDTNEAPTGGSVGEFWYKRNTNQLYEWDIIASTWVISSYPISSRWVNVDTSAARNSLILAIENRLFNSVHPEQQINLNLGLANGSQYAETELARFSAKYNLDTYAPDYSSSDAFTWNYSGAVIPSLGVVPARWFDMYKKNFNIPGVSLPTCRPNMEPWKLLNLPSKPAFWDSLYAATNPGSNNTAMACRVISLTNIPVLFGLQIIDGVQLVNGDRVVVAGQTLSQFNGIYVASASGWSRSSDVITHQLTIPVTEGFNWAGSTWSITTLDPIVTSVTAITFEQVRTWKQQMWSDIQLARPTLKLCVNIHTDQLIPPYVSSTKFEAAQALTITIPSTASNGYMFGDNGPVELAWKKSLEYIYGLSRSYFRLSPLQFLDKSWGETYMTVGSNVRVERNLMTPLPSSKFLMHGEKLNIINEYSPEEVKHRFKIQTGGFISWTKGGIAEFEVTHCADNKTVFHLKINNAIIGMVTEGVAFSAPLTDGITFSNILIDDLGIPFELGEKLVINFYDDIVDPSYVAPIIPNLELGCEGCVADGTPDVIVDIPMLQVAATYSHMPATTKKFKGTGQWFTNLLRYSYIDTDISQAALAYRGWGLKLSHNVGALIRSDSLKINTVMGYLPTTAYNVILKRSTNTESKWISALRIQLVQMGSKIRNASNTYVPSSDASDWIFRVEVYNPQYPFAEYYVLDTAGPFMTFNALAKKSTTLEWKRYTKHVSLQKATMPATITGLQNVMNFVYGYVDRLNDLGWTINSDDMPITDEETGRNLDWQLEVEKLADRVYSGISAGEGHIMNPFIKKAVLQTPIGLMARYTESNFIDAYSTQAAFDVIGTVIPVSKLTVIRTDDSTTTYSDTPIFSAHVFIDEFEHTILMNKKLSEEDNSVTIFDPFLGSRINSAYLSFIRQDEVTRKPTFDGFFLNGNDVSRNIVSGIDNIANYYDATQTFSEQKTADHALALLGFTRKDYFSNIGVTDTTQFNFWRGLIQAKGTNMTIDAFVNYKKFSEAAVDEYWAYKVAEYGDARERTFPEIKINPGDVTQKFARLQFYSADDVQYDPLPLFTQIENSDDSRWFSIDDLGTGMKFEAQHIEETVISDGPGYIRLNNIFHNGDSMAPVISGPAGASIIGASLIKVSQAGTYTVSGYTWLNPSKLSPIKLFDYQENVLVDEIGLWHPAIGIHAYLPLEVVNIINKEDPAHYNYTTQTTANPNYRHLKPWAEREVGRVWWDTSNLGYIPYYDATIFPNRDTRHSRWGALAEWASIDLYEWTASDVHPSEYDALAASQEGNSEIDKSVRASGKVALQKYYTRERIIKTRPIAWSEAGVGNGNAHPSFGPAEFTKVYASGNRLIVDTGRTVDTNLINGRNFGAWINNKPVGEVIIGTDIGFTIGSSLNPGVPYISPVGSDISEITIREMSGGIFGTRIGAIQLLKKAKGTGTFCLRMADSTGFTQDIDVADWYSNNSAVDNKLTIKFDNFGLELVIIRSTFNGFIYSEDIIDAVTNTSNDIYVRETIDFTEIIPLPASMFVNDGNDPDYVNTEYEWRTWNVPSQDDLDADLAAPRNTWRPYLGDEVTVEATAAVVKTMKDSGSAVTLRSGITINRFSSIWTEWKALTQVRQETISDGTTQVEFTFSDSIDANRLSVYSNGIQLNPSAYVITDNLVQVVNTLPEGTTVLALYRAYQPTSDELLFDPEVEDDVAIQTQYKRDYQFTSLDIRDESGNISGIKYYFWVQDKTIPQVNKNMSLEQAKTILKSGPSSYTIFSRLIPTPSAMYPDAAVYDSCAIAGLSSLVSKNDSYKLRFLRDFTLRDDPEELNLKNTHTEWSLIRKQQKSKIPKSLWDAVTNAVCGEDIGGKPVPSQVRIDYDLRNGTRSRFGFKPGQIFADTELVRKSITNTILNTSLTINLVTKTIIDYITALDFNKSDEWFADANKARVTMDLIWNTARASQINEIFFSVLEDALANNYEFSDIFKTSYITVSSSTVIQESAQWEQVDEQY